MPAWESILRRRKRLRPHKATHEQRRDCEGAEHNLRSLTIAALNRKVQASRIAIPYSTAASQIRDVGRLSPDNAGSGSGIPFNP